MFKPEDVVRDELRAKLNLENPPTLNSGVGQQCTFKQLGFSEKNISSLKPDGWYLPENKNEVAIVCETKNSNEDINKNEEQLLKYIDVVLTKYKKVIGIIYNGCEVKVYRNKETIVVPNELQEKEYYQRLFYNNGGWDKNLIYSLTKRINDNLHFNFGIKNLYQRMVFTACALVAKRYDALLIKGMSWSLLHNSILTTIYKSYQDALKQNIKLDLIADSFSLIRCNFVQNQEAIDDFIDCVDAISSNINSDYWQGEDVMAIFFNEFNRYKAKAQQGQVFTPEHITSLIYRITGTSYKDKVLDAACGSGGFLTKSMSNMIQEVGGVQNEKAVKKIKSEHLFGVEFDKEIFALACANMLIHKDGKTNITQDDSRTENVGKWIKSKGITKVLMNPPFEEKYGCTDIVENVLDNVSSGAICAFILPDTRLELKRKKTLRWLTRHSLLKIIKLPEDIFSGVTSSVFIFKTGEPQNDKPVFTCWIKEDGLETVKNQGRQDIKNKWKAIEDYWADVIYKQSGDDSVQWLTLNDKLQYHVPEKEFQIDEKDFKKTILEYVLFESQIDEKDFKKTILEYVLFESQIDEKDFKIIIQKVDK